MTWSIWDLSLSALVVLLGALIGWWLRGRLAARSDAGSPDTPTQAAPAADPPADAAPAGRTTPAPGPAGVNGTLEQNSPASPDPTPPRADESPAEPESSAAEPQWSPAEPESSAAEPQWSPAEPQSSAAEPQWSEAVSTRPWDDSSEPGPAGGAAGALASSAAIVESPARPVQVPGPRADAEPLGAQDLHTQHVDGEPRHAATLPAAAVHVEPESVQPVTEPVHRHAADETVDAAIADPTPTTPASLEEPAQPDQAQAPVTPVALEPAALEPAALEPAALEPPALEPAALEPAALEPTALATVPLQTVTPVSTNGGQPATTGPDLLTDAAVDDFRRLAGVGPKVANALQAAGIHTFAQLAETDVDTLREAVRRAGVRSAPTLPTWAEQARALANGR